MRVLLHTCCAPCTTYSRQALQALGHEVRGYFINPNIHPYKEFLRRLDTFRDYMEATSFEAEVCSEYGLRGFLESGQTQGKDRCGACYAMRLTPTAYKAKREGYGAFTTTLLISPYQNHDLIADVANEIAGQVGVSFLYVDLRPGYGSSIEMSKSLGLYRQPYCGCIFSEEERYRRS